MSVLRRILHLLRPYSGSIFAGLFCMLLATGAMLAQPILWQHMADDVVLDKQHHLFWPIIGMMVFFGLVGAFATGLRTWLLERTGQRFVLQLRKDVYGHVQRQPLSFFHERRTGDLISRMVGDVDTLQEVVINGTDTFISNILSMVGVAAVMIWYDWRLGTLTVAPVFFTLILMVRYNKKVKPVYRAARDKLGDVSAKLQENITGIQTVKAFAREDQAGEKFSQTITNYFTQSLLGISLRTKYMPAVQFISFVGNVIMIGFGAYLVIYDNLSIGVLLAYRGYWWHLYGPVYSIASINDLLQRANASGARVFELLDHVPDLKDAPDAKEMPKVKGEVVFDHVSFGYPTRQNVIKDITLKIPAGISVGLVGISGGGKSTLLSLVQRFYDPQTGSIRIDGVDVKSVTQSSLRSQMATVLQESFLFNDTVLENIRFGRPGASREDVERAARDANAHEFISELPQGYDTPVGERGVKLSGGQRQRIAIARAFLANPRILLLDEPTSAVEPDSEAIIQQALEHLMEGRTTFIVSHRLSIIRSCDLIVVIENGQVTEQGTHAELLSREGVYAGMVRMQMGTDGRGDAETRGRGDLPVTALHAASTRIQ
ncbi:MAG TPA: ABC transporter ATP-binding protein [Planctomycetota bacterium]|nr:ABC transporter ATP-binding protein [Planctomycetota bacterium]